MIIDDFLCICEYDLCGTLPFAGEAGCEQAEHTRPCSTMFGRSTTYGNLNVYKPIMVIHKYGNL
jgi:hypothetical protein